VNLGTPPPTPSDLSDRFAAILEGLYRATAAAIRGPLPGPLPGPLILLICAHLRRISARFAGLAARYAAGTLRPPRAPATEPRATVAHPPPPRDKPPRDPLPRGYAWLIRLVPGAAGYGSQLQYLLSQPEMAALIAAIPQMTPLLRPLCRALAAQPTPPLPAYPTRTRPPRPPREKQPRPPRQNPDPGILRRKPPPDEPGITWVQRFGMWLPEPIRSKPA
jgi:hypothetical protein